MLHMGHGPNTATLRVASEQQLILVAGPKCTGLGSFSLVETSCGCPSHPVKAEWASTRQYARSIICPKSAVEYSRGGVRSAEQI